MSHGIMNNDHAFYGGRQSAWHGLGTVIDEDVVTANEAMRLARLDWKVQPFPVYAHVDADTDDGDFVGEEHVEVIGKYANIRMDTGEPLGIVG